MPGEADRVAGVVGDRTGRLAGSAHRDPPKATLHEVTVRTTDRDGAGGVVRLLTDLTEPSAAAVAEIYRLRRPSELFFRRLKVYAGFNHPTARSPAGVLLNFYVATVGVLLMYLHMNSRPSKYAFSLPSLAASGAADLDEIVPTLRDRERQAARERERRRRKPALPAG